MRNPAAPKVKLKLDKEYTLILDMNAMSDFEEATGKAIHAIGADMSMKELRALIWACMRHSEPDLTPEDVGRMIHAKNLFAVGEQIGKLYSDSMPEEEDIPDAEPKAEAEIDEKAKN